MKEIEDESEADLYRISILRHEYCENCNAELIANESEMAVYCPRKMEVVGEIFPITEDTHFTGLLWESKGQCTAPTPTLPLLARVRAWLGGNGT